MNRWRRYVYLVVDNLDGTYPLRRIDASTLFLSRNQARLAYPPPGPEETPLPRPHLSFSTPSRTKERSLEFLGLFGRGGPKTKSLVAAVDYSYRGVSSVYDVRDHAIHGILSPPYHHHETRNHSNREPISLAVGEALYVMGDREPVVPGSRCVCLQALGCFQALTFENKDAAIGWAWHRLQPPPVVPDPAGGGRSKACSGHGYTVVGGSDIWISTPGTGRTYSFDTVGGSWSKAGDWELPFRGRADFFPEHGGVWLGFSPQGNLLCCSSPDLGASVRRKPELDVIWHDWNPLGEWIPLKRHLVRLGSRRFCVAKMFERVDLTRHGNTPHVERFAVFTGLELQQPGGDGGEPTMLEHRSLMYRFHGVTTCWVF